MYKSQVPVAYVKDAAKVLVKKVTMGNIGNEIRPVGQGNLSDKKY